MSIALTGPGRVRTGSFDLSLIPLGLAGLFLVILVLLPMGWLLAYTVTDERGRLSWANIVALSDASRRRSGDHASRIDE